MNRRRRLSNPNMKQNYFENLPPEITIDIFSRLPVRSVGCCKCVCTSWLSLLETDEFATTHLSKAVPGLALYIYDSSDFLDSYKLFDFEEGPHIERHDRHYSPVTNFHLHYSGWIQGSVDGLLLLRDLSFMPNGLYVCNPITREYIELLCSHEFVYADPEVVTFGFGVSKITGQHKVVRVFHDCERDEETDELLSIPSSACQVYTLGTGLWREISPGPLLEYYYHSAGAFLNGCLHWLVFDLNDCALVSCFDVETEKFSTFCSPPLPSSGRNLAAVFELNDCLCMCDNTYDDEIVVWLMKEYRVESSWTKEFVVPKNLHFVAQCREIFRPIKVFEDGDILMACHDLFVFYYNNKTKAVEEIDVTSEGDEASVDSTLHTSSFLSLRRRFVMENVKFF